MVLVLNGVLQEECPLDTHSLFMQHPVYRDTANQLLSIPIKTVSLLYCNLSSFNKFLLPSKIGPVGLLYVSQREMAAIAPHDKNVHIVGSDDATTCIIVVVRHSGNLIAIFHATEVVKSKLRILNRFRSCRFSSYGRKWNRRSCHSDGN